MSGPFLSRREGGVLVVTLNRPDKGNALNEGVLTSFADSLKESAADESLRALVVTGAGDRFFCTGADLSELGDASKSPDRMLALFSDVVQRLRSFPTLTAAFVNGDCVGGGLGIALATDFVLGAKGARFGTPEITKGLFPYIISGPLMAKLGEQRAKALCFGGRLWSALEALQFGAVSEVASAGFAARSAELVALWDRVPPLHLRRGKESLAAEGRPSPEQLVQYLKQAVGLFRSRT